MLSCPYCLVRFTAKGAFIIHMREVHYMPERRAKAYWETNTDFAEEDMYSAVRELWWDDDLLYRKSAT